MTRVCLDARGHSHGLGCAADDGRIQFARLPESPLEGAARWLTDADGSEVLGEELSDLRELLSLSVLRGPDLLVAEVLDQLLLAL